MQARVDQAATKLENLDLVTEVTMEALLNPLILDKVFRSMDVPTLKRVRLVCTVWADVGATFLGKKAHLTFSTWPEDTGLTSFHHKLANNIQLRFNMTCFCYHICTCSPSLTKLPSNFAIILPKISEKLETLEFFGVRAFEPAQEIWSTYYFPNLTRISILADGDDLDEKQPPRPEMAEFRLLPSLKVFFLEVSPVCRKPSSRAVMSTICQNLVNSAPNLEEFHLNTNFYLDLTACKNFKKLTMKHFDWGSDQFEISEMTEMLESCRTTLESLTLDYIGWDDVPYAIIERNLYFPNLKHLRLDDYDAGIIKNSLNVTNLPKLKLFSLSSLDIDNMCIIFAMLDSHHLRHTGTTSLDIDCTHYPEFGLDVEAGRKVVNLFPAVKELKLKLTVEFIIPYDQYFLALKETMQSFGNWELACGQVEFEIGSYSVYGTHGPYDHEFGSLMVIAVLQGMAGWRGLTKTSIEFTGNLWHARFRLLDEMREAILSCRTIKSLTFTGFQMDEETKDNFQTFIGEHNLQISATD